MAKRKFVLLVLMMALFPLSTIHVNAGYVYTEYLRMNWGENGNNDGGYYSTYPSSIWKFIGDLSLNYDYRYDKKIKYDFR